MLFSSRARSEQSLVRWATPQLHDIDALAKMVDPALNGMYPAKSLSRFADILALCVQVILFVYIKLENCSIKLLAFNMYKENKFGFGRIPSLARSIYVLQLSEGMFFCYLELSIFNCKSCLAMSHLELNYIVYRGISLICDKVLRICACYKILVL